MFGSDIGPSNIIRRENETNVFIPCPFSGLSYPIWKINGLTYASFSVPENYIPFPYGLLIPKITQKINGTSFQCLISTGAFQDFLQSTVGTLIVHSYNYYGR